MSNQIIDFQHQIKQGISSELPNSTKINPSVSHAPKRVIEDVLTEKEKKLAVQNALRYFPAAHHAVLAKEFAEELQTYGRTWHIEDENDAYIYVRKSAICHVRPTNW